MTAATALGEGSALLGFAPLAQRASGAVCLVAVLVVAVAGAWWLGRGSGKRAPLMRGSHWLLSLMPSLLLASYAVAGSFMSQGRRSAWFLGGDHLRHTVYVAETRAAGNLSYAHETYPRGWHTLVATVWATAGGSTDGRGLRSLVEILSAMSWFLPVVLAVATAVLGATLAARCGLGPSRRAVAGVVASSGVLVPSVLANYQALGFENSWVAAIACAAAATEVVALRRGIRPVVLCAASLVVVSHSWQLLLPVVCACLGHASWRLVQDPRHDRRAWCTGGAVVLASALVSWPGVQAVVTQVGLGHAADSDVEAPVPAVLLACALVSSFVLSRVAGSKEATLLAAVVVLPSVTALAVAAALSIPVTDYYPSKLLWHTAVLGLGPTAVMMVMVADRLLRRSAQGAAATRVVGGSVAVVTGAYLALTPLGAFVGAWSSADGDRLLRLVTTQGAAAAQVVWLGSAVDNARGRILLDFYRAGRTDQRAPQEPLTVAQECDLLEHALSPTVLSDRPAAQVRWRYACVPGVRVLVARTRQ